MLTPERSSRILAVFQIREAARTRHDLARDQLALEIETAIAEGAGLSEIARLVGVSRQSIDEVRRRFERRAKKMREPIPSGGSGGPFPADGPIIGEQP